MASVVPISKIDTVVKLAIARTINGLVALQKLGLKVRMPKEIQITMLVCPDDGINAIPRNNVATEDGPQVVTTEEGGQTIDEISSGRQDQSQESNSTQSNETDSSSESGSQSNTQSFGRETNTDITYET